MQKYVSKAEYARLCGIQHQTLDWRISKGHIELIDVPQLDGTIKKFIDTEKYPPVRKMKESGVKKNYEN